MLRNFILSCLLVYAQVANAQQIKVKIDVESAGFIADLLQGNKVSQAQLERAAALYGSRQLIRKVEGYSGAGEDVFKSSLKAIIDSGTIKGPDPYNWQKSKTELPAIKQLLTNIRANEAEFTTEIVNRLSAFTPADLELDVKACFLVGGGSLGFTVGNDNTFNVALQNVGDDIEGLKTLVAHELYHSLQSGGQAKRTKLAGEKAPYNVEAAYAMCYELWAEGSANFVGDFTSIRNPKAFSKLQIENYRKNSARNRTAFYLLETVLFQAYHDSTVDYQQLYNIGFTTEFEEVFYGIGYEIARKLQLHLGKDALANIVKDDPILFISRYIELYRSKLDTHFFRFGTTTEGIIADLVKWKDRI